MTLTTADIAHIVLALALLLIGSHGVGHLFARLQQPRVIGEILGGLVLGPTLLGALLANQQTWLFPDDGAVAAVLGAVYQLGLLLLMFCSGAEIRSVFNRDEGKTVAAVTCSGTLLPFVAGLAFIGLFDPESLRGTADSSTAFLLVFAIAIAVTSIPVISRIMFDLRILETSFARIVLAAAVIEDILLYVVLAIALGLATYQQGGGDFGVPALIGIESGSELSIAYHVLATLLFFGFFLFWGPRLLQWSLRFRYNLINQSNPIAYQLVLMLTVTGICTVLGVTPLFGAFVAGMVAATSSRKRPVRAREDIKDFAFAFFVPIYFAIVGLRLDLIRDFNPLFFLAFLAFACAAKSLSVYLGSRLSGESAFTSRNLAAAMNARGGPGIVLASVAFDARIINEEFYATLVMLAIVTSLLAGSWLERVVRSGRALRDSKPAQEASIGDALGSPDVQPDGAPAESPS